MKTKKTTGVTTVRMLLTLLVLLVMVALFFAHGMRTLAEKDKAVCKVNRLEIGVAKLRHAVKEGLSLTNEISGQQIFGAFGLRPICPEGGEYLVGIQVGDSVTCTKHF